MKNHISLLFKNLAHPAGIIGLIISLAIPFLIYLAPNIHQKNIIRDLDLYLPLPLFCLQLALAIVLFFVLNKDFREWFRSILPEKTVGVMAIIFAVAVAIFAGTQIEARHRVQSDESVFMSVAQNMYYNHESGTCNQGLFEEGTLNCTSKSNSFKTKGLAFLYYIGMPLFGTNLHWIFNLELLLLPLAFLLMFLAIVAWTRQPLLAFFASLLLALQPTILFQFRAMSVEPLYVFLSALSLFFFKWAYDRNTLKHWILLALVLAFFAQTRQETAFCLLSFIIFALPKILDQKDFKAPAFFLTLSIFSIPALLTISYFQGFGFQGGEFEAHGHFFEDLARNWQEMTKPLTESGELENPFLTYFNYIFVLGLIYLIFRAFYDSKKGNKFYLYTLVFLALYHIQTYVILENVSGDFSIQINQRYSLVMLPSMAFIGALPLAHFIEYIATTIVTKQASLAKATLGLSIVAALILSAWTAHYKSDFNNNIMYNRNHLTIEEHEIWGWLNEQPQANRLFIYGRPWHFVGYGVSSIHYDQARQKSDAELQKLIDKYKGEVYYIRGLDCWNSQTYHKKAVEHRIATTCDIFEREMDMVGVKNILITNNYWVQIAKFNGRKNYDPKNIITIEDATTKEANGNGKIDLNEVDENTDVNKIVVDTISYKYNLLESGKASANWEYIVLLNSKIMERGKYEKGEKWLNMPIDTMQPGYNQIRFLIQDIVKNSRVVDISKFYYNKANGVIPLTSLKFESHKQGWGSLHTNESVEGHKLTIDSQKFDDGLGTHAESETVYKVDRKYSSFRTSFGLDDESLCSEGIYVQIIGDGKVLAQSQVFQNGAVHTLTANIQDVETLTLKSLAKDGIDCAHVDFVNSILIP